MVIKMADKISSLETYLKQVSDALTCPNREKKVIIKQIRLSLQDIPGIEDMNEAELREVTDSPQEIAELYLEEGKGKKLFGELKTQNIIKLIIAVIALVALVFFILFVVDTMMANHGYTIESQAYYGEESLEEESGTRIY